MPKNNRSFHTRLASLTVVLFSFFALLGTGSAMAATTPSEGIFDSCDIASQLTTCEQDLSVMAQGGFNVVVPTIGQATEAQLSSYAQAAQSDGIKVMWEIDDAGFWGGTWNDASAAADYPEFAASGTATSQVLDTMIQFLSAMPNTYGYYAADDEAIEPGQGAALDQYVSQIKSLDNGQMVMVGANSSQGQSNAASGAVIGNEIYPDQGGALNASTWQAVGQMTTQAQSSATHHGQSSAFILQAFTFGDNLSDGEAVGVCTASMSAQQCANLLPYPSQQIQTELRNEVLQHSSAKLIIWFNFEETYGTGNRWAGLTAAIKAPTSPNATAANAHKKTANNKAHKKHAAKKSHKSAKKHAAKKA